MVVLTEDMVLKAARAPNLTDVVNFNCWGMELSDLTILERMPEVEVLSLSINNVATLTYFSGCAKLRELYLRRNFVADLSEITHLLSLPELRCLWLSNNPIADEDNYRMSVLRTLPGLTKLDDKVVTNEEREAALTSGADLGAPVPELKEGEDTDGDAEPEPTTSAEPEPEPVPCVGVNAEPEPEPVPVPVPEPGAVSQPACAVVAEAVPPAPPASGDMKHKAVLDAILKLLPLLDDGELSSVAKAVHDLEADRLVASE